MNSGFFDLDFQIPVSPPHHEVFSAAKRHQNPRKKRSNPTRPENVSARNGVVVSRPKYGKKLDPGAPKITRPCSECGKKFWSWKALFGHMRCHPERQWRGINPPPEVCRRRRRSLSPPNGFETAAMSNGNDSDHEIAACLLLLANGASSAAETTTTTDRTASTSYDVVFECSSCKKIFRSHQALGGHRASHKNVKGCFAITRSSTEAEQCQNVEEKKTTLFGDEEEGERQLQQYKYKCGSVQALGEHKRRHWAKRVFYYDDRSEPHSSTTTTQGVNSSFRTKLGCSSVSTTVVVNRLDLNLPAHNNVEDDNVSSSNSYGDSSSGPALDLRLGL